MTTFAPPLFNAANTSYVYSYNFGAAGVRVCTSADQSKVDAVFGSFSSQLQATYLPCDINASSANLADTIANSNCYLRDPLTLTVDNTKPCPQSVSQILSTAPLPYGAYFVLCC